MYYGQNLKVPFMVPYIKFVSREHWDVLMAFLLDAVVLMVVQGLYEFLF